jgi:hypothetical protein
MISLIKHIISHINPDSKKSRRIILLIGLGLYFIIFFLNQHFQNSSLLWGDEWEYQSMAVNLAKGYGLQIHGGLANFEDYKFLEGSNDYAAIYTKQHSFDFYRTPLYPMFVGMIYKIFGISPYIAKIIQLLLIVFVGAYLPLLAYNFWGRSGFFSGIIATPVFISLNYKFAGSILTEPLIIFIIFLVIVVFQFHYSRNNILSAIQLGFVLALSWLTKGILMPLSVFLFGYYFWKFIRSKNRKIFINTAAMGMMFILTILPYSLYVNSHSKEFILISSQGKIVMLESHNEFIKYGFWGPQGRTDPKSFYYNDHMENASQLTRVANFYKHHPELIFKLLKEKLITGFTVLSFFWLLIFCIIADHIRLLIERYCKNRNISRLYGLFSIVLIIAGFVLIAMRLKGQLYLLDTRIFKWFDFVDVFFIPLLLFIVVLVIWNYKKEKAIQYPFILSAVILNFLFMVAATCLPILDNRYVKVIDFIFVLLSVHYLISYITKVFVNSKTQPDAI